MTGGGVTTMTNASWMEAILALSAAAIAGPDNARELRCGKSSSGKKISAALELCVKPFTDMPANSTACETPGCLRAMSAMRRVTASVRSSEAAGGSCATATRYCLSCAGMKPSGTNLKLNAVSTISPA